MLQMYIDGAPKPVAIKYRREGFQKRPLGGRNRYEVSTRFSPRDPRHRLLLIYVGIIVVSILLLVSHFLIESRQINWLPERSGEGRVLEKRIEAEGRPDMRYVLLIRVSVPPADAVESDLLPWSQPGREKVLGPLELTGNVTISQEDWKKIAPGAALRVHYTINSRRTRVVIREIYLDGGPADGPPEAPEDPKQAARLPPSAGNFASAIRY